MKTSQAGKDLIISFEGIRLQAYKCPAGVWTIGVGSTQPPVKPGEVLTKKEAMDYKRDSRDEGRVVPLYTKPQK